jgi:hypothetical protein
VLKIDRNLFRDECDPPSLKKPFNPDNRVAKIQTQQIAIIDPRSNTNRFIIMNTRPGFSYRLVDEVREVIRLRQGMTKERLSNEAIAWGLSTLH